MAYLPPQAWQSHQDVSTQECLTCLACESLQYWIPLLEVCYYLKLHSFSRKLYVTRVICGSPSHDFSGRRMCSGIVLISCSFPHSIFLLSLTCGVAVLFVFWAARRFGSLRFPRLLGASFSTSRFAFPISALPGETILGFAASFTRSPPSSFSTSPARFCLPALSNLHVFVLLLLVLFVFVLILPFLDRFWALFLPFGCSISSPSRWFPVVLMEVCGSILGPQSIWSATHGDS